MPMGVASVSNKLIKSSKTDATCRMIPQIRYIFVLGCMMMCITLPSLLVPGLFVGLVAGSSQRTDTLGRELLFVERFFLGFLLDSE